MWVDRIERRTAVQSWYRFYEYEEDLYSLFELCPTRLHKLVKGFRLRPGATPREVKVTIEEVKK